MGLMDQMYGASFMAGPNQANALSRQLGPLRAISMMQRESRMAGPQRMPRSGHTTSNPLMQQQQGGDLSGYTYNPEMRAQAEGMGIHPLDPSQVNPNALLPNSGFFGGHPMLAKMLEGAMFGAANTQGSDTTGEGISNVARGMIQGPLERRAMINRQFEAPFQNASLMQGFQKNKGEMDLNSSMIEYHRAQITNFQDEARHRKEMEGLGYDKMNATRPVPVEGGTYTYDGDKGWGFHEGPGAKASGKHGGGFLEHMLEGQLGPEPAAGTPEAKKWWGQANPIINKYYGGQAAARTSATDHVKLNDDTAQTKTDKALGDWPEFDRKAKRNFWRKNGVNPDDPTARRNWYLQSKGINTPGQQPAGDPFAQLLGEHNLIKNPSGASPHFADQGNQLPDFFPMPGHGAGMLPNWNAIHDSPFPR